MAATASNSQSVPLFRRRVAEFAPVTPRSIALFRLGELCNHHCPMCSNSGRPDAWQIATPELLRRVQWLHGLGMRRVVVTGGEPTVHPGFLEVAEALRDHDMGWDINTNGSRLHEPGFCATVAELGLLRAIVSLHASDRADSAVISGTTEKGHDRIVAGIDELLRCGVAVMVNAVATRTTLHKLSELLRWGIDRWGAEAQWKFVFPSTAGKGGSWEGIALRYGEVADDLKACAALGEAAGVEVSFESVPPCTVGDRRVRNVARSGFGETHYLDDLGGDRLYAIAHIEAHFNVFAQSCRGCSAFADCPGVAESYLRSYGTAEFRPL
ncbi:MAG: radical SAM protein [Deltaproteobacteria bacterium]|nr:radical SAM protein [Deltaproteobacteria bacterium]